MGSPFLCLFFCLSHVCFLCVRVYEVLSWDNSLCDFLFLVCAHCCASFLPFLVHARVVMRKLGQVRLRRVLSGLTAPTRCGYACAVEGLMHTLFLVHAWCSRACMDQHGVFCV
eukprot:GDKI01020414.1.p3 GENE.GDKI01020414.1~~GDKI01020414.1.p3  ORF type:complete len:113 (-),score=8.28 GDKI01020414.1:348-686(-)